ncbi:MAG: TerB family tellurite resistance protein [Gammaproteobacteria bacterium]|nr:TerB family tellurite resistance protein [Gammaproteobacteria bacterium]NVK88568.1 TerB family tellurite resistance protein [Gammaproteobacteria bacterium]
MTRSHEISQVPSHVKMIMASISSYAKDGKYSVAELERIITIALEDGEVDADERRVLQTILEKASNVPFDDEVKPYITALSKLYL